MTWDDKTADEIIDDINDAFANLNNALKDGASAFRTFSSGFVDQAYLIECIRLDRPHVFILMKAAWRAGLTANGFRPR